MISLCQGGTVQAAQALKVIGADLLGVPRVSPEFAVIVVSADEWQHEWVLKTPLDVYHTEIYFSTSRSECF